MIKIYIGLSVLRGSCVAIMAFVMCGAGQSRGQAVESNLSFSVFSPHVFGVEYVQRISTTPDASRSIRLWQRCDGLGEGFEHIRVRSLSENGEWFAKWIVNEDAWRDLRRRLESFKGWSSDTQKWTNVGKLGTDYVDGVSIYAILWQQTSLQSFKAKLPFVDPEKKSPTLAQKLIRMVYETKPKNDASPIPESCLMAEWHLIDANGQCFSSRRMFSDGKSEDNGIQTQERSRNEEKDHTDMDVDEK